MTYADATAEAHKFVTKVTETSGVISVERAALTYDDLPASDLSAHFDYIGAASEAEAAAKSYSDELSVSLSTEVSAQLATKLDASAVVDKLALSSLADITTELDDDYVTEVYCGSTAKTTVVDGQKVVVLSALAFKDTVGTNDIDDGAVTNAKIADESVTEAKLSGLFVWDCGGAADPA